MKKFISTVFILATLSGCSTIFSRSNYDVVINSIPDGAYFVITNRAGHKIQNGVTPTKVTLKSSAGYFQPESYTITLKKKGYTRKTFTLTSTIDGWYIGNILLGGVIGMLIVDPASGAMYNLPHRVDILLGLSVTQVQKNNIVIASIDSLTEEQKAQLKKIE